MSSAVSFVSRNFFLSFGKFWKRKYHRKWKVIIMSKLSSYFHSLFPFVFFFFSNSNLIVAGCFQCSNVTRSTSMPAMTTKPVIPRPLMPRPIMIKSEGLNDLSSASSSPSTAGSALNKNIQVYTGVILLTNQINISA